MRTRSILLLIALAAIPVALSGLRGLDASAAVDPVDDGCPLTNPDTNQAGSTLQGFAAAGTGSVIYDGTSATLQLKKEGGLFSAATIPITDSHNVEAAADYDGDGWTDLVVGKSHNPFIYFYKNRTYENAAPTDWTNPALLRTPKFVQTTTIVAAGSETGARHAGMVPGDFDGDGKMDFAYYKNGTDTVSNGIGIQKIYWGAGNGTFPTSTNIISNPLDLGLYQGTSTNAAAVDWNKDGWLDIVFGSMVSTTASTGQVLLLTNACPHAKVAGVACSVKPSFTKSVLISGQNFGNSGVNAVGVADFNSDGYQDILAGSPSKCSTSPSLSSLILWRGTATGFAAAQTIAHEGGPSALVYADFTLDGKIDFATGRDDFGSGCTGKGGKAEFWKNNGTTTPFSSGTTSTLTQRNVAIGTTGVSLEDYDLGSVMDYDHDPENTLDFLMADGNNSGKYLVFANRTLSTYVACADVQSTALALGSLASEEMVVTAGRLDPNATLPPGTSITYYMTNESPENWQLASPCSDDPTEYCVAFPHPTGNQVKWKATLCSNAAKTATPKIAGVAVAFDYTVAETHFRAGAVTQDGLTYVGAFKQPGSRGHLYAINPELTQTKWDAATKIDAMTDASRKIYGVAADGTTKVELTTANAGTAGVLGALNQTSDTAAAALITWLRSARFGAVAPLSRVGSVETGTPSVIAGPPEPLWYDYATTADKALADGFRATYEDRKQLVLFGSRDGMVHAIRTNPDNALDPTNGTEAWAYVPRFVATQLAADKLAGTNTYPDGAPTVVDVKIDGALRTVAIMGAGNGGRYVFALDVTATIQSDGTVVGPTPLWEIMPGDAPGLTFGKPAIARVIIGGIEHTLALLSSGISPDDASAPYEKGREVVGVDIATGEVMWTFEAACPVTSDVVAFETNDTLEPGTPRYDGYIDRAAFADACGNVYKIDPAQDLNGDVIDSSDLNAIDTGIDNSNSANIYALFSTKHSSCGLNAERPIVGTLGARPDGTGRFALFFGTGGIESYDPSLQNAFFAIYTDNGEVRGCADGEQEKGKILGECTGGLCEKFYGGIVVTTDAVLATRAIDPPIATSSCTFGSSELVGFDLENLDEEFTIAIASSTVSALYAVGGAVYFTTLSGAVVRVGSASAAGTDGTSDPEPDEETEPGVAFPLSVTGWRQIQ